MFRGADDLVELSVVRRGAPFETAQTRFARVREIEMYASPIFPRRTPVHQAKILQVFNDGRHARLVAVDRLPQRAMTNSWIEADDSQDGELAGFDAVLAGAPREGAKRSVLSNPQVKPDIVVENAEVDCGRRRFHSGVLLYAKLRGAFWRCSGVVVLTMGQNRPSPVKLGYELMR